MRNRYNSEKKYSKAIRHEKKLNFNKKLKTDIGKQNFFLVGSLRSVSLDELKLEGIFLNQLNAEQLKLVEERSMGVILTDDYAPVENFIAEIMYDWQLQ